MPKLAHTKIPYMKYIFMTYISPIELLMVANLKTCYLPIIALAISLMRYCNFKTVTILQEIVDTVSKAGDSGKGSVLVIKAIHYI